MVIKLAEIKVIKLAKTFVLARTRIHDLLGVFFTFNQKLNDHLLCLNNIFNFRKSFKNASDLILYIAFVLCQLVFELPHIISFYIKFILVLNSVLIAMYVFAAWIINI